MPFHDDLSFDDRSQAATAALSGTGLGPVEWVAETGSTNADLLAAGAAGAAHGLIRVANHQTAGRGRRDRTWVAAAGDALMVSFLLRPTVAADELGCLSAAVALAAAEECRGRGFAGVSIKWPNDLVVGAPGEQRKLAGILAQSQLGGGAANAAGAGSSVVVVGLGLNLAGHRSGPLSETAVALEDLGLAPDPVALLVGIARRLSRWLVVAETDGAGGLWARYRDLSATIGQRVRVERDSGTLEGLAVDVMPNGALAVEAAEGRHEIVVGDVISLRPG